MSTRTVYIKTGLLGGSNTAVDGIDGDDLLDGDVCHAFVSDVLYTYMLDDDSGAVESSPDIISPDANAGDKRWILQNVYGLSGKAASGANADITSMTGLDDDGIPLAKVDGAMKDDGSNLAIGSDADGDIYYRASSVLARLAKGTAYQKLQMNSGATAPEWATDPLSPWLVDVNVFTTLTNVNWSTLVASSSQVMGGHRQSTNSQNCYIEFPVVLSAGTWTFSLIHLQHTDVGIYTLTIDGDSKGTIDGYNAGGALYNYVSTITGIAVATPGKKVIRLTMATKNASSSGYYGNISAIRFVRTA